MKKHGMTEGQVNFTKEVYPIARAVNYGSGNYKFIRKAKAKSLALRPERGNIMSLSKRSLIRLMFTMQCTSATLGSMLTLTYPKVYPKSGKIVKKDINVVTQMVRRKGWSYVWFLEFQKRGAPHIHFLLSPGTVTPHMRAEFGLFWTARIVLSEWFLEECPEGKHASETMKIAKFNCHEKTFELLRLSDGAKRYATKYAAKEKQKKVPSRFVDVGRFWGASLDIAPEGQSFDVSEDDVEQWLVENNHPASAYELVPKHVWGVGELEREADTAQGCISSQPLLNA